MKRLANVPAARVANGLAAAILVVVPFHAFLTVWASTLVGHFLGLRLWDELLLAALWAIVAGWLWTDAALRRTLLQSLVVRLIAAYLALTIVLGLAAFVRHAVTIEALAYACIINVRFLIWLLAVWALAQRSPWLQQHWRRLALWPLAVVAMFALLQFFVLPHDFLTHVGYGDRTYVPFVTINQDSTTIRVQSFLRGANPLGAYLAAMVGLLAGVVSFRKRSWRPAVLLAATLLALVLTFSRSAWIGAVIALIVALGLRLHSARQRLLLVAGIMVLVILVASATLVLRDNSTVQDLVLHVSSHSTAQHTSNEGHYVSLRDSLTTIAHQPFGGGPGTSGQASWYNAGHPIRNTESYFLQIGEETGWLGLGLFLLILVAVGRLLWRRRGQPLALGLLAGLAGLLVVSQFSYAWTDDTLAFVWWGLAGIALALPERPAVDGRRATD